MRTIQISGTAYWHLSDTSPGSLSDEQLGSWGYEPEGEGAKFVGELRQAIHDAKVTSRGFGHRAEVTLPTDAHARALANKLFAVGEDFSAGMGGYDEETKAEGRRLLKAARSILEQLERPGTYEGVVLQRKNRETGTTISLVDGQKTDAFDTSAGRWQTICEQHGAICSHHSRATAVSWMSSPKDWCDSCGQLWEEGDDDRETPERDLDLAHPDEPTLEEVLDHLGAHVDF